MRKHLKKIKAQAQSVFGSPSQSAGKVVELQPYTRLKRLCLAVSPKKNKGFLLKWSMSKDFCCSLILRHSQVGSASKSHQVAQQFSLDALQQQLGDPVREQGFCWLKELSLENTHVDIKRYDLICHEYGVCPAFGPLILFQKKTRYFCSMVKLSSSC